MMKKLLKMILAITVFFTVTQCPCVYADGISTAYGTIPAEYADANTYPIAVFFSDGTFWSANSDWDGAIKKAVGICDYGYGASILIRNNITVTTEYNSLEYMRYPLTIDLGGNSVTLDGGYLGQFANRFSLNVTVKNGSFILKNRPLFDNLQYYSDSYTGNLNFENITFSYGSGATVTNPVINYTVLGSGSEVISEAYTNCTFDFRANCPQDVVLFKVGVNSTITNNITVNGCALLANDISKINIIQSNNESSSIVFGQSSGEYMTISIPENSSASSLSAYVFPTAAGNMVAALDSTSSGYDIYKLSPPNAPIEPVSTPYGTIPAEYANADNYPIVVFFSDGTFWSANSDWNGAITKAVQIATTFGYGASILIRDDIAVTSEYNSLEYMLEHPLIIDLGGNTVTLSGAYLGMFENRWPLNVTVKNGSFVITQYPVFKNYHDLSNNYTASLNFEDITFTYGSGATLKDPVLGYYVAGSGPEVISETYTNCTFDFRANCPNNVALFKLGIDDGNIVTSNITVNGCALLANDMSKITVMQKNNTGSSIVFAPNNGEYMTISIPENSAECNEILPLSNERRRYVLDSTSGGTSLYKLSGGIFMTANAGSVSVYNISGNSHVLVGIYSAAGALLDVLGTTATADTTLDITGLNKTGCANIKAFLWDERLAPLCAFLNVPLN